MPEVLDPRIKKCKGKRNPGEGVCRKNKSMAESIRNRCIRNRKEKGTMEEKKCVNKNELEDQEVNEVSGGATRIRIAGTGQAWNDPSSDVTPTTNGCVPDYARDHAFGEIV